MTASPDNSFDKVLHLCEQLNVAISKVKDADLSQQLAGIVKSIQSEINTSVKENDYDDVNPQEAKSSDSQNVSSLLTQLSKNKDINGQIELRNNWGFDTPAYFDTCSKYTSPYHCIPLMMRQFCHDYNFYSKLDINEANLYNFLIEVSKGYLENPYHSRIHGCDVMIGTNYILRDILKLCNDYKSNSKLKNKNNTNINRIDSRMAILGDSLLCQFSCLISAACHDIGHPGTNNDFQIKSESKYAVLYNDGASILENYHISQAWQILKKYQKTCDFMQNWDRKTRRLFRKYFIQCILATDISKHFKEIESLNGWIKNNNGKDGDANNYKENDKNENENENKENQSNNDKKQDDDELEDLMGIIVHSADIGSLAYTYEVHNQWSSRILTEIDAQNKKEKELNLHATEEKEKEKKEEKMNDKDQEIEKIKISHLSVFGVPLYKSLSQYLNDDVFINNVNMNIQKHTQKMAKQNKK